MTKSDFLSSGKVHLRYRCLLVNFLEYNENMSITDEQIKEFSATISKERLSAFIQDSTDTIDVVLERYQNNILISQALYPELSIFEITLRNAIDTMLKSCFSETWIEDEVKQQNLLLDYEHAKLVSAYNSVKNDRTVKRFTIGKVIANLNFGFWVNLCSKKYNAKIWTKKGTFKGVFVNYPNNIQQINNIARKLDLIKALRNKVYHYVPVLKNPNALLNRYNDIQELLSYLPHDKSNMLMRTSSFLTTYNEVLKKTNRAK